MKTLLLLTVITILSTSVLAWDYFLFSQVWPPSWLDDSKITDYNYTNNYFTVHGFWPEDYNGSWPQYCKGKWPYSKFNETMLDPIISNLTMYWTDFKDPEKFWEHEYYKHLLCAENIYSDPYDLFYAGLEYREKYDLYSALESSDIYPNNWYQYKVKDLERAIEKVIGYDVIITCQDGILNEVYLCMTKNLTLFDCPKSQDYSYCRNNTILYNYYKNNANRAIDKIIDPAV